MKKPKKLKKGDYIAIVSLSSGILGESMCKHQLKRGIERLESFGLKPIFMPNALKGIDFLDQNPKARAQDLKDAFFDDRIKGIICAIGGDDTYRLLPHLIEDEEFIKKVKESPKLFTGFSDTTNNHLMFYKLGVVSFYGPNFLSDIAELEEEMLPYTKEAFETFFKNPNTRLIKSSPIWYLERNDFSVEALGTKRKSQSEKFGYKVLYGNGKITGGLLGGCLESLYDGYTGTRYPMQKEIYIKYKLMPDLSDWEDKILFFETSEETPKPNEFKTYLEELERQGVFDKIVAMMVGKPQNEIYFDEYNKILSDFASKHKIPTIVNINFGHAYPRNVIPYGITATIDFDLGIISLNEPVFSD
ncbi:MAG: carboxypeptidase [Tenericutes bacterium HGW-Tenericutes-7]|nr:MAG: carboxypeptidase [Tenericutes bacterium HGW-Tenericutes-7]